MRVTLVLTGEMRRRCCQQQWLGTLFGTRVWDKGPWRLGRQTRRRQQATCTTSRSITCYYTRNSPWTSRCKAPWRRRSNPIRSPPRRTVWPARRTTTIITTITTTTTTRRRRTSATCRDTSSTISCPCSRPPPAPPDAVSTRAVPPARTRIMAPALPRRREIRWLVSTIPNFSLFCHF